MGDHSELKRLAAYHVDLHGDTWYSEESLQLESIPTFSAEAFIVVASPAAVLALIAENERLSADCSSMRGSLKANAVSIKKLIKDGGRAARERDQLRAEVAGLKTGYEAYERVNAELKAEVGALRQIISDSATSCGAAVSVECTLDFMGHLPGEIFSVISKLRNALAECANSLQGEMLQKFGGQLPEDMHPVTRRDYDRDMAELAGCRAAIGKGEQS